MARLPDAFKSLVPIPKWLVGFIVFSLAFLFLGVFFDFPGSGRQKEVVERLKTTAEFESSMLTKFDDLSNQVRSAIVTMSSNARAQTSTSDNIVIRSGHRGTRKLCSYSEEDLKGILSLRHQCGWKHNRYYYAGTWMPWKLLHSEFQRDGPSNEPECVLACKYHSDLHCSKTVPCIHAFYLRHKSSDSLVLRQLYEWGEHNFLKPYFRFNAILDAGANIGLASALFATMYPSTVVISVEASERNFKMLRLNTEPYPNVIPINAAIWPKSTELSLINGPRNPNLPPEWGFMVVETSTLTKGQSIEDSLTGVSIPYLLKIFGLPAFDFCKIDIEGSEGKLFSDKEGDFRWVDQAKIIALELHGDMVPGSNVTVLNFFERKQNFKHMSDWSGEYVVYKRRGSDLE